MGGTHIQGKTGQKFLPYEMVIPVSSCTFHAGKKPLNAFR